MIMNRKRILAVIICLLFLLSACKKSGEKDPSGYNEELGGWAIYTAQGLELLREHPADTFFIMDDIDCQGMTWVPVQDFSGKLSGVWGGLFYHTISNLTIQADSGDLGFFSTLSGTVSHLNFDGITLNAPEGFAGNAGVLAGTVTGEASYVYAYDIAVTASGSGNIGGMAGVVNGTVEHSKLTGTLTGTSSGNVGGYAGQVSGFLSQIDCRTDVSLTANAGSVGGMAGILGGFTDHLDYGGSFSVTGDACASPLSGILSGKLNYSNSSARSVCVNGSPAGNAFYGKLENSGIMEDCWERDRSNLREIPQEEAALRQLAEQRMYEICTVHWIPSVDMDYTERNNNWTNQHFIAGQDYFGMPYTHHCGSLERFRSFMNEDDTLVDGVRTTGWEAYLGNDCSDALYWAWATASASITYTVTDNMICNNGTVQAGDYILANQDATADTCQLNGEQAMYEAYAQLQMADALLTGPGGHARMVVESPYVYRNPDGTINPDVSYVRIHEQGSNYKDLDTRRTTCAVNKKIYFSKLFSGNYIPITIPEFAEGKASEPVVTCENPGVGSGMIRSNYRINWVTANVYGADGTLLLTSTLYPTTGAHNDTFDLTLMNLSLGNLDAGSYRYQVLVGVGNHQEIEVSSIPFTK